MSNSKQQGEIIFWYGLLVPAEPLNFERLLFLFIILKMYGFTGTSGYEVKTKLHKYNNIYMYKISDIQNYFSV